MDFIVGLVKILFWGITLFALLYALLTHFIFWLEQRLFSIALGQPIAIAWGAWLYSFSIEFICLLLNYIVYPFRFWFAKLKKPATVGALPILLVHGYLHHQNAWAWFIHRLQDKPGIGPIYSMNLSPAFASIATLAETLQDKIQAIQKETGSMSVILIGHSMGGLVCSYYTEFLRKSDEIAKVITIGSPFKGTWSAVLGLGQNCQEMSPNSSFLQTLVARIKKSNVPYYSILSKMDNIVIPWRSGLIYEDVSENDVVLEDHGHLRLLISPVVIEQVYQWIKQ